jgi:hypothetical protein
MGEGGSKAGVHRMHPTLESALKDMKTEYYNKLLSDMANVNCWDQCQCVQFLVDEKFIDNLHCGDKYNIALKDYLIKKMPIRAAIIKLAYS